MITGLARFDIIIIIRLRNVAHRQHVNSSSCRPEQRPDFSRFKASYHHNPRYPTCHGWTDKSDLSTHLARSRLASICVGPSSNRYSSFTTRLLQLPACSHPQMAFLYVMQQN